MLPTTSTPAHQHAVATRRRSHSREATPGLAEPERCPHGVELSDEQPVPMIERLTPRIAGSPMALADRRAQMMGG